LPAKEALPEEEEETSIRCRGTNKPVKEEISQSQKKYASQKPKEQISQSEPDSGRGFQVQVLKTFELFPFTTSPHSRIRSSSSLLLSSLELSDTKVYEPQIRALLGTASHQIALSRSLICTAARRNQAACGTNQGDKTQGWLAEGTQDKNMSKGHLPRVVYQQVYNVY